MNDNTVTSGIEEHAAWFAARYWGGAGVEPKWTEEIHGSYDIDGGRPTYVMCWTFRADGFTYIVYENEEDRWVMCTTGLDGAGAEFFRDGNVWKVRSFYTDTWKEVEAR